MFLYFFAPSSLFRRRAWKSSPEANTPILPNHQLSGLFSFIWLWNRGPFYLQQAPDIPIYHIALMLSDSPICTFALRINLRLPLLFKKVVWVAKLRKITRPSFYAPSHSSMLLFFFCAVFHDAPKFFIIPII